MKNQPAPQTTLGPQTLQPQAVALAAQRALMRLAGVCTHDPQTALRVLRLQLRHGGPAQLKVLQLLQKARRALAHGLWSEGAMDGEGRCLWDGWHEAAVNLLFQDDYRHWAASLRLLLFFDAKRRSFVQWFVGFVVHDRTVGVAAPTLHSPEYFIDRLAENEEDSGSLQNGGHWLEWALDPAQTADRHDVDYAQWLERLASEWAAFDSRLADKTPQASQARAKVYLAALQMLAANLAAQRPLYYPKGGVRVEPEQRQMLEALSGYSTPVVRGWLRDLGRWLKPKSPHENQ